MTNLHHLDVGVNSSSKYFDSEVVIDLVLPEVFNFTASEPPQVCSHHMDGLFGLQREGLFGCTRGLPL